MSDFVRDGVRYQIIQPNRWQWVENYIVASAKYTLLCPPSRLCKYGSGIFWNDRPLGSVGNFSGQTAIQVFGVGAIHMQIRDNAGPCLIGIAQLDMSLVSIGAVKAAMTPSFWVGLHSEFEKWWREHHQNQMPPLRRP